MNSTNSNHQGLKLNPSDKIILVCTGIMGLTAWWMHKDKRKYDHQTQRLGRELRQLRNLVIVSNENIQLGNAELIRGNEMLRSMMHRGRKS